MRQFLVDHLSDQLCPDNLGAYQAAALSVRDNLLVSPARDRFTMLSDVTYS
jgi:hypothetical protein